MRLRDLIYLVGSNLRRMKLRLALTSLGVVIGTSAIVLMLSLGIGLQANVTSELSDMGQATDITVYPGMTMDGSQQQPLDAKAIDELEKIEHVAAVIPSAMLQTLSSVKYKRTEGMLNVRGLPGDTFDATGYELAEGRWPRGDDEIVIGARVADNFAAEGDGPKGAKLKGGDLMGKRLVAQIVENVAQGEAAGEDGGDGTVPATPQEPRQYTKKLKIVGVLEEAGMEVDQSSFMEMEAVQAYNGAPKRRPVYDQFTIKADEVSNVEAVESAIKEAGFESFSQRSMQDGLNRTFMVIQGVLGALGAIAMLVASLGIANTMTMSIFERTREIGIMKALGASSRQVKRIFLAEAAVIGVLGGLGGLILSMSGAALANLFVSAMVVSQTRGSGADSGEMQQFFMISPPLAIFAIVFAAGVGLLAGVLPAVRAANLDPLAALRHE